MRWDGRQFPHPVLQPDSDDYPEGRFRVTATAEREGSSAYRLRFQVELHSGVLQRLVAERAARLVLHMECPRTRWRRVVELKDGWDLRLSADLVRGTVAISPLVVAAQNIAQLRSDEFHEDYEQRAFTVGLGDVLAMAPPLEFVADPRWDPLKRVSSIFRVARNEAPNAPPLDVSLAGEHIIVLLSPSAHEDYRRLAGHPRHHRLLAGLVILPVLVSLIEPIRRNEDPEEWHARRWRRLLAAKLETVPEDVTAVSAAHRLIGMPVPDALRDLARLTTE